MFSGRLRRARSISDLSQVRLNGSDDAHRQEVLQGKYLAHLAIVAVSPDAGTGFGFAQLPGHAHLASRATHAAFENITHAEFASDRPDVNRLAFVDEGRVARDDEQPLDAGEAGDDFLDHPVHKIVLLAVAGQVAKRHHGDGRAVSRRLQARRLIRLRIHHFRHEADPLAGRCPNEPLCLIQYRRSPGAPH